MFGGGTGPALAAPVLKGFAAPVTCYKEDLARYGQFAAKNSGL
jgi:hypothetical protein